MPAHLEYEHDYPALWVVAKLPKPPVDYGWPEWAAEESIVRLSEINEVIDQQGSSRAFWYLWSNLEWLPMVVSVEEAYYVHRPKTLVLLFKVKWARFGEYYPVYLTYTNTPFTVLIRNVI